MLNVKKLLFKCVKLLFKCAKIFIFLYSFIWIAIFVGLSVEAYKNKYFLDVFSYILMAVLPFAIYAIIKFMYRGDMSKAEIETLNIIRLNMERDNLNVSLANNYFNNYEEKAPLINNEYDEMDEYTPKLIKCPACGKEVSNQAVSCPNCGQPILEKIKEKEREEEAKLIARYSQIEEYGKNTSKKKGGCNVGYLIIIVMFAAAIIVAIAFPNNKASDSENNSAQQSENNVEYDGYDYKCMVESAIKKELYPDAKFDFVANYRTWSVGTFTMV